MDYLEKLEQSLNKLESEADKLSNLPELIREIGKVADGVSQEKEEISNLSEKLTAWSDSVDNEFKEMNQTLHHTHSEIESIKKDMNVSMDEIRAKNKTLKTLSIISIVISLICCGMLTWILLHI